MVLHEIYRDKSVVTTAFNIFQVYQLFLIKYFTIYKQYRYFLLKFEQFFWISYTTIFIIRRYQRLFLPAIIEKAVLRTIMSTYNYFMEECIMVLLNEFYLGEWRKYKLLYKIFKKIVQILIKSTDTACK
jgi:hypothetical protein